MKSMAAEEPCKPLVADANQRTQPRHEQEAPTFAVFSLVQAVNRSSGRAT
jgi:hypothetical protein